MISLFLNTLKRDLEGLPPPDWIFDSSRNVAAFVISIGHYNTADILI